MEEIFNTNDEVLMLQSLKKLGKALDSDQLKVCTHDSNAVVAAGAGSGKTQVLATRFAWLIMHKVKNADVSRILTLTFTKKAAGEMYERIYKMLHFFAHDEDTPKLQKERALSALNQFNSAHIQTLDSFCNNIVKECAMLFGIRPDFKNDDVGARTLVIDESLQFLLCLLNSDDKNEQKQALLYFMGAGEVEKFASEVIASACLEHTSLATPKHFFASFVQKQREYLAKKYRQTLLDFAKTANEFLNACQDYHFALKNYTLYEQILQEDYLKDLYNVAELFEANNAKELEKAINTTVLPYLEYVATELKCSARGCRDYDKEGYNSEFKPLMNSLRLKKECKGRENIADFIVSLCATMRDMPYAEKLCDLLDDFTSLINNLKRTSGLLTFKDVSSIALLALLQDKTLRAQKASCFDYIMIDEFQDNNAENRDLLFLLALKDDAFIPDDVVNACKNGDKNALRNFVIKNRFVSTKKLFFVGDEKQSIYKFRGADVSVFSELNDDLCALNDGDKETYLHMSNNYRSNASLLASFNALFGGFFAKDILQCNENKNGTQSAGQNSVQNCIKKAHATVFSPLTTQKISYEAYYPQTAIAKKVSLQNAPNLQEPATLKSTTDVNVHVLALLNNANFKKLQEKGEVLDEKDQIAYSISSKIVQIYQKEMSEFEKGLQERKPKWSDFAILERSRIDAPIIARWLLKQDSVPFTFDVQANLFSEAIANDFYTFFKLVVFPSDSIAFASFLQSPFASIDEDAVQAILALYASEYSKESDSAGKSASFRENFVAFDDALDDAITSIFEENEETKLILQKYFDAKTLYIDERKKTLARPINETVSFLWYNTGYRYETYIAKKLSLYAEAYDMLFALAVNLDMANKSVADFVDALSDIKAKEENPAFAQDVTSADIYYPLEKDDAVTIMSIHKSKGLQFRHVFVYGAFATEKAPKKTPFYFDDKMGLAFLPVNGEYNYFFLEAKNLASLKERAEFRRLLYVAITRAEESVYISGSVGVNKDGILTEAQSDKIVVSLLESYYPSFYLKDEDDGQVFDKNVDGASENGAHDDYKDELLPFEQEEAPFTLTLIKPKPKSLLYDSESANFIEQKLKSCRDFFAPKYACAQVIKQDEPYLVSFSPSSFETLPVPSTLSTSAQSGVDGQSALGGQTEQGNLYANALVKFVERYNLIEENDGVANDTNGKLASAAFGTIMHLFLEDYANGVQTFVQNSDGAKDALTIINKNVQKLFTPITGAQRLQNALLTCQKMTNAFFASSLGKEFLRAKSLGRFWRTEWSFKLNIDFALVNGTLDAIFESDDGYIIVDYKTDSEMNPEKYIYQQQLYRLAVKEILGVQEEKIRSFLYFLCYETSFELTPYLCAPITKETIALLGGNPRV